MMFLLFSLISLCLAAISFVQALRVRRSPRFWLYVMVGVIALAAVWFNARMIQVV